LLGAWFLVVPFVFGLYACHGLSLLSLFYPVRSPRIP
jgi:hypothetical protein